MRPRKFNISRIIRYKWLGTTCKGLEPWWRITTKAPQPLYDLGMNFGARFAYDEAQCDGPWNCELNYNRFGRLLSLRAVYKKLKNIEYNILYYLIRYFVGCNNLGMFPFPLYDTHYLGAKWFALPGPCSSKTFEDR